MHYIHAKSILSSGGGRNGMNIYRGCTHGCIYCDSRSDCYGFDHDFIDIAVKRNAPELLEDALSRRRKPCMIGSGSMCDPYMHCEKQLGYTRRCLEIIDRFGFGVTLHTKSDLVLRDLDLLERINENAKAVVQMTLTTYDESLCRVLEPHVCTTYRRFEVLKECRKRDIPTVVWLCPVLPYINDTEANLRGILSYCFDAGVVGVMCFGFGVTLRAGSREYFYAQLDRYFPGMKDRYIKKFGQSYECASDNAQRLWEIFDVECASHNVMHSTDAIFSYLNEFPERDAQLSLFDIM